MNSLNRLITIIGIVTIAGCNVDCIDKKTGIHKSSKTIDSSIKAKVYQFRITTDRKKIKIDKDRELLIKNAWIENSWLYECIDNKATIKKEQDLQLVIEGEYKRPKMDTQNYSLFPDKSNRGVILGGRLTFSYSGQDTIQMKLFNNKMELIDSFKLWKII